MSQQNSKYFVQHKLEQNDYGDYTEPSEICGATDDESALQIAKGDAESRSRLRQGPPNFRVLKLVGEVNG